MSVHLNGTQSYTVHAEKKIETEEKAKVVVWGDEFIQFLAAL